MLSHSEEDNVLAGPSSPHLNTAGCSRPCLTLHILTAPIKVRTSPRPLITPHLEGGAGGHAM